MAVRACACHAHVSLRAYIRPCVRARARMSPCVRAVANVLRVTMCVGMRARACIERHVCRGSVSQGTSPITSCRQLTLKLACPILSTGMRLCSSAMLADGTRLLVEPGRTQGEGGRGAGGGRAVEQTAGYPFVLLAGLCSACAADLVVPCGGTTCGRCAPPPAQPKSSMRL